MDDRYRNTDLNEVLGSTGVPVDERIRTIEMHTGGEPLRVIVNGYPDIPGTTILEQRRYVTRELDHLRTALMYEPRGHADMYGLLPVSAEHSDSEFGVLFMHNEGYSTMCGHATLAITRLAIEAGWVKGETPVTSFSIDAPCGQLRCHAKVGDDGVLSTYFDGVPSFVAALDERRDVPGVGEVVYDLAYGGAFYAFVDLRRQEAGVLDKLSLTPDRANDLAEIGMRIKRAVAARAGGVNHPFEEDLGFLYGTIFIDHPLGSEAHSGGATELHSRNVCIFAEGEVDRSPTGSGVSARAAIHRARGELGVGENITIESIVGSTMTVEVLRDEEYGPYPAVIPRVGGGSWITGTCTFVLDPTDPLRDGFLLR